MNAEIIAVGSELLTPYRLDTNSLWLTDELNKIGIRVIHKAVVGDSRDEMRSSFRHALDRADLIIASGGLGPIDANLAPLTRLMEGEPRGPVASGFGSHVLEVRVAELRRIFKTIAQHAVHADVCQPD
jgi:hypothetical protein